MQWRAIRQRLDYYAIVAGGSTVRLAGVSALASLVAAPVALRRCRHQPLGRLALATGLVSTGVAAGVTAAIGRAARANSLSISLADSFFGTAAGLRGRPPEVVSFSVAENKSLAADLYLPCGHGPRTAVVVVHGGAWQWGDKGENVRWSRWLAEHGYLVLDIQYRLAPGTGWRQMVSDVRSAVSWLRQHAADLCVDPDRLALLGRSAGGHLALLAAYAVEDATAWTAPWSVVALYAPTDLTRLYATAPGQMRAALRALLGGDPLTRAEAYRLASPVQHVQKRAPRTLLIHGAADEVVPAEQSKLLIRALHHAGARVDSVSIPCARHAFDLAFDGLGTQLARAAVLAFLDETTQPTLNQC